MNSVVLIGRLTRDPEIRYVSESQMAVATFTVAIDRPVRSGQEKKTDFPRVTVFGRQAENCERFLAKGRLVGIQGRIQTGSYTNKDGATVYTTDVVLTEWNFSNGATETTDLPREGRQDRSLRRPIYLKASRPYRMTTSRSDTTYIRERRILTWKARDAAHEKKKGMPVLR